MRSRWRISYGRGIVLTVVAGLALSAAFAAAGTRIDRSRQDTRDRATLAVATGALRTQLDELGGSVLDLAGFFEASHSVQPDEFEDYARPQLRRTGTSALVYSEYVTAAQRASVERRRGAPLRELRPDGTLARAGSRPDYLIVTRQLYAAGGRNLNGVDLLTDPARRTAIARAERHAGVSASGPVVLVHNGTRGIVVYAAVRKRTGALRGVVSGGFAFPVLSAAVRRELGSGARARVSIGATAIAAIGGAAPNHAPRAALSYGGRRLTVQAAAPPGDAVRLGPLGWIAGFVLTLLAVVLEGAGRNRRRVRRGEARFADAFEASPIGQALGSPAGRLARSNAALSALTGHPAAELAGCAAVDLVDPADRERTGALVTRALATPGVAAGGEVRLLTVTGELRWAQMHFTRLRDPEAAHPLLMQVVDVSDRRGLEVELRHQAEHDALTELLNRRGFRRRLDALLDRSPDAQQGALMLIDLDHFKAVNDTLGHHVGDQVIHAAGRALRGSLRADDIVARIGGDEFAVLLPGADLERAKLTAERLAEAIGIQARAPEMAGLHGVSASVGVAMLDGAFATADAALMAADLAMYDAKAAGRRRTSLYDDRSPSSTQTRLHWVDRIRTALADERFVLVAQPIRDLSPGRTDHHELLLRMLGADGAHVAPGTFVPIAEQFGLMGEIDRWVVTTAIRQLAEHPDRDLVFEINLSGSSLGSAELLVAISDELVAGDVAPGRVIFEITETAAVTNLEEAHAFALQLATLGCRFALDDFGVGFGSFAYVKRLPFDFLKIDGEFVRHSATSDQDRVILESLIHAARGLGKRTIAEYVEDSATEELLRELGVDMVQGFHIGRPQNLAATIAAAPRLGLPRRG